MASFAARKAPEKPVCRLNAEIKDAFKRYPPLASAQLEQFFAHY
jgi:hypothetical protein